MLKVYNSLLMVFLFVSVLFPTGSVFGYNFKIILVMTLFFVLFVYFSKVGVVLHVNRLSVKLAIFFIVFISFYSIVAAFYQPVLISYVSHLQLLSSTFFLFFFLVLYVELNINQERLLIRRLIIFVNIYCIVKIVAEIFIYYYKIPYEIFVLSAEHIFGYSPISYPVGDFLRINMPNDYIVPISIYLVMMEKKFKLKFSGKFIIISLMCMSLCLVISYSRYLWLYGIFVFVATYLVIFLKQNNILKYFQIFVILSIIIMVLFNSAELIAERYSGSYSESSDYIRKEQMPLIFNEIMDNPIFGKGIGGYVESLVIFPQMPWNYVLQWLSFVLQFGILGLVFVLFLLAVFLSRQMITITYDRLVLTLMLFLWLGVGFFNTFLLSSAAGICHFLFFITYSLLNVRDKKVLS